MIGNRKAMRFTIPKNDFFFTLRNVCLVPRKSARAMMLVFDDTYNGNLISEPFKHFLCGVYLCHSPVNNNQSRVRPLTVREPPEQDFSERRYIIVCIF